MHTCRADECRREWMVEQRLAELHEECRDFLLTRPELKRLLKVPATTLHAWIVRDKRLPAGGENREGKPLYRYGDALDLNETRKARSA